MLTVTHTDQAIPFGPYTLHELLNSGGMADIWHASDQEGKPYAIKKMHDHLRLSFLAKRRFFRGCEVLSRIHKHEYVIGYVEHGKINGIPYLVMDYVESDNLKQLVNRGDEMLEDYVGNILIDMALALDHMHDCGFMHLDFKPENVLVTRNANVRLVDFDLARPIESKPVKVWKNPGTPSYMAPEQLMKRGVDRKADIFSFGVTAYEVLTSRKPFPGESPKEVLRQQLAREGFLSPTEVNPGLPAALDRIILKCLETKPENRYPFMSVVVRDLENALYV